MTNGVHLLNINKEQENTDIVKGCSLVKNEEFRSKMKLFLFILFILKIIF